MFIAMVRLTWCPRVGDLGALHIVMSISIRETLSHKPITEFIKALRQRLFGYYRYYGVTGNYLMLERDLLEEILMTVRSQVGRNSIHNLSPTALRDLVKFSFELIKGVKELGYTSEFLPTISDLMKPIEYIIRRGYIESVDGIDNNMLEDIHSTIEQLTGTSIVEKPETITIMKKRRNDK
jgi:hypothetical protein